MCTLSPQQHVGIFVSKHSIYDCFYRFDWSSMEIHWYIVPTGAYKSFLKTGDTFATVRYFGQGRGNYRLDTTTGCWIISYLNTLQWPLSCSCDLSGNMSHSYICFRYLLKLVSISSGVRLWTGGQMINFIFPEYFFCFLIICWFHWLFWCIKVAAFVTADSAAIIIGMFLAEVSWKSFGVFIFFFI